MTHVVAVTSIGRRDTMVSNIRKNLILQNADENKFEIVQDRVNRICIYHKAGPTKVLVKTILVIVVQVHINLESLNDVYDDTVLYDTHEVLIALQQYEKKIKQLKYVTSRRKEKDAAYSGLVKSLSNISVEYGACSDL